MKLFEVLEFNPRRFLYALQQELIELEPNLEVEITKATHDSFKMIVKAGDLEYELALEPNNDVWIITPWLLSLPVTSSEAVRTYAICILHQLKQELVTVSHIVTNRPELTATREVQTWIEKEVIALFKYLFPGAARRLKTSKNSIHAVVIDADDADEAGLQLLQTRYNSTVVSTKKLKDGYEAILLAQLDE